MIATTPTIITFSFYIVLMLALGWLGYRSTKNLSDYILGGRRLGSFVTALAAGASDMSAWLLMALPGAVYLTGISASWAAIGLIIGAWLNWRFVAARLRVYTEKSDDALTLPDYFAVRFRDKSNLLRIFTALAILIFFSIYCASGIVASARLFQNMFGMTYEVALWVGAFATISYVFIGGFLAVSWTDTVQASLMFVAIVITPITIIYFNHGIAPSIQAIEAVHINHTNMLGDLNAIGIISLLAWGLGYFGQPHILARFMAAKSAAHIPSARRISMTWMILCISGAIAIGFFGVAYFKANPAVSAGVTAESEMVFIELTRLLFNPWIGGMLLAAILAAVMSTLSAQLLVCSSALTEDIYRTFLRKKASQKELVWVGRVMLLGIALFAIWLASNPQSKILSMVGYAWAGFGAAFGPLVLFSLLWSRVTRFGAMGGILVGTITVIVWKQYAWFDLYEIVPGFIFSSVAIVVVSLLSPAPSSAMLKVFEAVEDEMRGLNGENKSPDDEDEGKSTEPSYV